MFGYVLITLLVLVGPLAYLSGVDSRIDERSRDRRFLGGRPHRAARSRR